MTPLWFRTLLQHVAVLAAGVAIGWMYDAPYLGFTLTIAGMFAWHLYHLFILERWLTTGEAGPLPSGNGPWSQVLARIQNVNERARESRHAWRRRLWRSTRAGSGGGARGRPTWLLHTRAGRGPVRRAYRGGPRRGGVAGQQLTN